jgi:PadR family transcriptional regulator
VNRVPSHAARLMTPILTMTAVAVLRAVRDGVRYGFDIMDATALPSGTVYPILGRLERSGFVKSRWEAESIAQRAKRPPRRYYQVTAAGERALTVAIEEYRQMTGLPATGTRRPAHGT